MLHHYLVLLDVEPSRVFDTLISEHSWSRLQEFFDVFHHSTNVDGALNSINRYLDQTEAVVIGPDFLDGYALGREHLKGLFEKAGVPENRLIIMSRDHPKLPPVCEHMGEIKGSLVDTVLEIVGHRPVITR